MKRRRRLEDWLGLVVILIFVSGVTWAKYNPNTPFFGPDWNHFLGNLFSFVTDAALLWGFYEVGRWQQRRDDEELTPIDER